MSEKEIVNTEILDEIIVGRVEPKIYAFKTDLLPNYLKIGDTYRPLNIRINEWKDKYKDLEKVYDTVAKVDDDTYFRDHAIHKFLSAKRINKSDFDLSKKEKDLHYSVEFFKDVSESDLKDAVNDIYRSYKAKDDIYQFYRFEDSPIPIKTKYNRTETFEPRPNQKRTIDKFNEAIKKGRTNLLMYAVMRFGKSFTSMCCAVKMEAKFVLVVSAKADVKNEWKRTVESHIKFDGYSFIDSNDLLSNEKLIKDKVSNEDKFVLFLTLQDLQGKEIKDKHKEIFANEIDLLLIDETHFGARADSFGEVLKSSGLNKNEVKKELELNELSVDDLNKNIKFFNSKFRIHLSGTPYRILMNSEFTEEDIIAFYQFSDISEDQKKWDVENQQMESPKEEWENPYYGFPEMIRFAFNPNTSSRNKMEELKRKGITYSFSELFRPKSIKKDDENNYHKEFIYKNEVHELLSIIDGSKNDSNILSFLDYDKIREGNMCRHLVCVLPYRASCDALENMIKSNKFKNLNNYEILNISGLNISEDLKDIKSIQNKIKCLEKANKKTITLTVNKMLTGSTVQEWDTMIYLKDTASPQEYDQAIFRLQNQYIKTYKTESDDEIKYNQKPQTILVDFNPNRMFIIQEQKSQIYNVNTEISGNTKLEERIKKELEISPIITINNNKIIQIKASDILDEVRKYSNNRSILDEALNIGIDLSLLEIKDIKDLIESLPKIDANKGITIENASEDGDDIEVSESNEKKDTRPKETSQVDDNKNEDIVKKFATYYANILFFAFLTNTKVKSLKEIIDCIDTDSDNIRIVTNLNLKKSILNLFLDNVNPFVLRDLDYKIQNINTLSTDKTLNGIERVEIALKKFAKLSPSEVITPIIISDLMIKNIPNIDDKTNFLDFATKQGEYVYSVYKKHGKKVANNFYSIPTSKIAYEFTRKVYNLLDLDVNKIEKTFTSYNLIKDETKIKDTLKINEEEMKFNVIIGNPPYQQSDGGAGASAKPIYNEFVNIAKKLDPDYISILMPTRWYAGGKGLDSFRNEMLEDKHILELHDFLKPDLIFTNINLRGGICNFLWYKNYDNTGELVNVYTYNDTLIPSHHKRMLKTDDSDIFIRHYLSLEIINKLKATKNQMFSEYISSLRPFGFRGYFTKDERFKDSPKGLKDYVICYGKSKKIGYVDRNEVKKNIDWIDKFKVFTPRANNIGTELNDDNLNTFIGEPSTICTESYIVIGANLDLDLLSASNLCKYFKTKFARFCHSLAKASQDATSKTYRFLPIQDFTDKSDIDWTKSIEEIDSQLYEKYQLSKNEIEFIDSLIKPMDN